MKKKRQKPVTGADLRFRHLELAKRLAKVVILEMEREGLTQKDIPQVMNDLCKLIVLSQAEVNKEDALFVVNRFVALTTDLTCLMMRIVSENFGKGLQSLKEETSEPRKDMDVE